MILDFARARMGAIVCMAALGLAACSGSGQGQGAAGAEEGKTTGAPVEKSEPPEAAADVKKVYIATLIDHPALNDARDGVVEKLESLGRKRGRDLEVKINSAQGNTSIAGQIAKQFASEEPDVIVAVATPVAQSMVATTSSIPIVFAAVTDPVEAKLVASWENSGNNVTGVSDKMPLEDQIRLVRDLVPGKNRVGYVYSPGEVNSTIILKRLEETLPPMGLELVSAPAQRTTDIPAAALSLAGKADVIYSSLDNNVTSAYESLFQAAKDMKVPLVSADTANVPRGAVAALGVNYKQIGLKAGEMVDSILKGTKPADIPSASMSDLDLHLSTKNAAALGVEIPRALLERADFIDGEPAGGEGPEADSESADETASPAGEASEAPGPEAEASDVSAPAEAASQAEPESQEEDLEELAQEAESAI